MRRATVHASAAVALLISLGTGVDSLSSQQPPRPPADAHMAFTPSRAGTAADTARALAVVDRLRAAIVPFQTLEAAGVAGYVARKDPDMVKPGGLLHVGLRPRRGGAAAPFDPTRPRALLFRRDATGALHLAGAMFVAPPTATEDELDAMVPLSVAHWHRHLNVCAAVRNGGIRRFPRATTPDACQAVGGHYRAESAYMVHVMTDAGDDPAGAFPQGHDMEAMDMGPMGARS